MSINRYSKSNLVEIIEVVGAVFVIVLFVFLAQRAESNKKIVYYECYINGEQVYDGIHDFSEVEVRGNHIRFQNGQVIEIDECFIQDIDLEETKKE